MPGGHALGAARSRKCCDFIDLRTLRRTGDWPGSLRHSLSRHALDEVEQRTLSLKTPPDEQSAQLGLLCPCGRRPVELKARDCCRLCYYRRYHSLRWFGGLRELILKRDRFRCCACGAARRRLVVHHRAGRNVKPLLVTLCIRCHVRLHHSLGFRRWVPEALLGLWRELHPGPPLQLQLPLIMKIAPVSGVRAEERQVKLEAPQPRLAFGEKPGEQPLRCAEAFIGQADGSCSAYRAGEALRV
jgi:hypothetical protein